MNCAMGGNLKNGEFLRPILTELGMDYVTMSEWPEHDIKWDKNTWLGHLLEADIIVCPQNVQAQPAKSNNRVTQAMSLGKPVICSPLPAYLEVVKNTENGFICTTPDEWKTALQALSNQALRKKIGEQAKRDVLGYSIKFISEGWRNVVHNLTKQNSDPPKVDIIIPTMNNLKYLIPCIESVRKNSDWPNNIIVVASMVNTETRRWIEAQPDIIRVLSEERWHFSKANNKGLEVAKEKYVCLLNDDTLVGRGWLGALMHEAMKPGIGAVGPFSNCDRGWLHDEAIRVESVDLVPNMKMEDLKDKIPNIVSYTHRKEVHERKWVAFYCTLMPRAVIDKVGPLDEGFLSGDEDVDYCKRMTDLGYKIHDTYDSWVFHFGGKTRKAAEDMDHARHHEEDIANHAYFHKKWGITPADQALKNNKVIGPVATPKASPQQGPLFGIYTGEGWEKWTPLSLNDGGIGGSETATVYTARAFQKLGWQSVVFGDCDGKEGMYDGVRYLHHSKFPEFIRNNHFKLFASSRRADIMAHPIKADKKIVIVHDIWLSQDKKADLHPANVDKYVVLSPWHKGFFLEHHSGIPEDKILVSRDGVDLSRFKASYKRDPGRMIYSSSPDRGLDVLLEVLPRIREQVPSASLHVFYGFANWEKVIRQRGREGEVAWMEDIKRHLDDPGVVSRGRIGQDALAKEILKSDVWAYPTYFWETFCMSSAEMMAAGTPIVTSDLAGLSTTVGSAGVLIPGESRSKEYKDRFVDEVVKMMKDRDRWNMYSEKGKAKAATYQWDTIASEWISALGLESPK